MPAENPQSCSPCGQFDCGVTFNSAETFGISDEMLVCEYVFGT